MPKDRTLLSPQLLALTRSMQARTTAIDYLAFRHNERPDPDFDAWFTTRESLLTEAEAGLVPHSRERMEAELRMAFDAGRQTCLIREVDIEEASADL